MDNAPCAKIEPLIDAFHDGELTIAERKLVADHLEACLSCQKKLADIQKIVLSLKSLPQIAPNKDFAADFQRRLDIPKPRKIFSFNFNSLALACACAAFALFLGFQLKPRLKSLEIAGQLPPSPKMAAQEKLSQKPEINPATTAFKKSVPAKVPDHLALAANNLPAPIKKQGQKVKVAEKERLLNARQKSLFLAAGPQTQATGPQEGDADVSGLEVAGLLGAERQTEQLGIATDEDGLYALKL